MDAEVGLVGLILFQFGERPAVIINSFNSETPLRRRRLESRILESYALMWNRRSDLLSNKY